MAKERYKTLLDKSIAAAISAIEIYNKPDFKYREETFAILMVNAWEILFKAKLLKDNKNKLYSIYISEKTTNKKGESLKRFFPKENRCGNPMTIEIFRAMERLEIDKVLKENIELLIEIRDNAIHYVNKELLFEKKILEIGTANLRSYVKVFNDWFEYDLSRYNFYLMPISFFHSFEMESFSINKLSKQTKNLLQYIILKEIEYPSNEENDHNISLKLTTKFEKGSDIEGLKVGYSDSPDFTIKVDAEDQFAKKYPLDYDELVKKIEKRYSDFIRNKVFWALKRKYGQNKKYSDEKYLNFIKKKGTKQRFYSTEIFKAFDENYTKK